MRDKPATVDRVHFDELMETMVKYNNEFDEPYILYINGKKYTFKDTREIPTFVNDTLCIKMVY